MSYSSIFLLTYTQNTFIFLLKNVETIHLEINVTTFLTVGSELIRHCSAVPVRNNIMKTDVDLVVARLTIRPFKITHFIGW